ncbi:hypothetical protein CTI12_AA177480 [Artemisia annua]|uniref:Uncharacterized protein n=1 Tax=Artemisia annua TaxID=35608 RepID=A0A2U1P8P5_ARTAN|nr:hypothetical protein CTI12_AA177480 [Artemisia annua]
MVANEGGGSSEIEGHSGTDEKVVGRRSQNLLLNGEAKDRAQQYQGKVTTYVIIACVFAAIGGSIFGYDIGISG